MAQGPNRSRASPSTENRYSSTREIPKRFGAQCRCLVQGLRDRARGQVISETRRSHSDMVTPLRIAFVEWPEGLSTYDTRWAELKDSVTAARPDILITNELPFGPWLADSAVFSEDEARLSLRTHDQGLEELTDLRLPAVISSRPVRSGKRLANEAFVLE